MAEKVIESSVGKQIQRVPITSDLDELSCVNSLTRTEKPYLFYEVFELKKYEAEPLIEYESLKTYGLLKVVKTRFYLNQPTALVEGVESAPTNIQIIFRENLTNPEDGILIEIFGMLALIPDIDERIFIVSFWRKRTGQYATLLNLCLTQRLMLRQLAHYKY